MELCSSPKPLDPTTPPQIAKNIQIFTKAQKWPKLKIAKTHFVTYGRTKKSVSFYMNTLHKFVKPTITRSQFKSNISALSLTASYHIFLCKDNPTFLEPPYLLPPLVTKEATASS